MCSGRVAIIIQVPVLVDVEAMLTIRGQPINVDSNLQLRLQNVLHMPLMFNIYFLPGYVVLFKEILTLLKAIAPIWLRYPKRFVSL